MRLPLPLPLRLRRPVFVGTLATTSLPYVLLAVACVSDDIGRFPGTAGGAGADAGSPSPALADAAADARAVVEPPGPDAAIPDASLDAPRPDAGVPAKCNAAMPFVGIQKLQNLDTPKNEIGVDVEVGGRTLWVSVDGKLARSTRTSDAEPWSVPSPITNSLTNQTYTDDPSLSDDGRLLFFAAGSPNSPLHIYRATRTSIGTDFVGSATLVGVLNSSASDSRPRLRRDGKEICFHSNRGLPYDDIWCSQVVGDAISEPKAATELNSTGTDACAVFASDGLSMYLTSDRGGGVGTQDIWVTTRTDLGAKWANPRLIMGGAVNSGQNDQPGWISDDECTLYVISNRSGNYDIWSASRM
jgi:WD40-like Beta Propeller Repeat